MTIEEINKALVGHVVTKVESIPWVDYGLRIFFEDLTDITFSYNSNEGACTINGDDADIEGVDEQVIKTL